MCLGRVFMVIGHQDEQVYHGDNRTGFCTYILLFSWSVYHERNIRFLATNYYNQDLTPVTQVKSTIHILLSNLNRSSSGCHPRSPSNCLHLRSLAQRHTWCRLGKPACHLHSNTNVSGGHLPIGYQTSRLSMSQSWHDTRSLDLVRVTTHQGYSYRYSTNITDNLKSAD